MTNILYCGDKNIADGVIISTLSLLKNSKEKINIYILTAGCKTEEKTYFPLSAAFIEYLDKLVKAYDPENSATLYDISDMLVQELPEANMGTRFTPCCMLRLFADKIKELPDRILYLDNDVVCRGDIRELYGQDMQGCEIAGVLDHYGKWFFRKKFFRFDYLNSGVLLLDLAKIRQTGLFRECRQLCKTKKMFMPDQSAINKLSKTKKILPRKYNEQRKLQSDTVLQHFTTSFRFFPYFHSVTVKPWHIEKMHKELKLFEYDAILCEYEEIKSEYKEIFHE